MGEVVKLRRHALASKKDREGRGTRSGHSNPAGQLSENQRSVRSSRRTWMSAPFSMAPNFFVSPSARQLTVERSSLSNSAYARAIDNNCSMPVMDEISVNLLRKSTAILPRAPEREAGYFTGMELGEIIAWIDRRKAAKGFKSYAAIEKEARLGRGTLQNLFNTVRRGYGSLPKQGTLTKLARTLGDAPPKLLTEPVKPLPGRKLSGEKNQAAPVHQLQAEIIKLQRYIGRAERKIASLREAIKILERKAG